jgi:hypothetical protein
MWANCVGWLVYSFLIKDLYVLASNEPGLVLATFMTITCYGFADDKVGVGLGWGGAGRGGVKGSRLRGWGRGGGAGTQPLTAACEQPQVKPHTPHPNPRPTPQPHPTPSPDPTKARDTMMGSLLFFSLLLSVSGAAICFWGLTHAQAVSFWWAPGPGGPGRRVDGAPSTTANTGGCLLPCTTAPRQPSRHSHPISYPPGALSPSASSSSSTPPRCRASPRCCPRGAPRRSTSRWRRWRS